MGRSRGPRAERPRPRAGGRLRDDGPEISGRGSPRANSSRFFRSLTVRIGLDYQMPAPTRACSPHPLLLEPTYWRQRLSDPCLSPPSLLVVPRPDLSSSVVEVGEIRMRACDGTRLWGMMGRCTLANGDAPIRIRLLACDRPLEVDREAVKDGWVDFAVQEPAGRRLEDRVLDVMRAVETVRRLPGVDPSAISLIHEGDDPVPDEFLIAERLLEVGLEG